MSTILTNVDPSCPVWEVSNFNLPDFDTDNLIHKTFEQVKDSKNHTNTLRQVCEYPYENFATEWRNNCIDIRIRLRWPHHSGKHTEPLSTCSTIQRDRGYWGCCHHF